MLDETGVETWPVSGLQAPALRTVLVARLDFIPVGTHVPRRQPSASAKVTALPVFCRTQHSFPQQRNLLVFLKCAGWLALSGAEVSLSTRHVISVLLLSDRRNRQTGSNLQWDMITAMMHSCSVCRLLLSVSRPRFSKPNTYTQLSLIN